MSQPLRAAASVPPAPAGVHLRPPVLEDGKALHGLVADGIGLDENSPYAYLLVATHFASTSVVAERDGRVVGFVAAYRPPSDPDALFVWQVGVAAEARRCGLGLALLREAVDQARAAGDLRHVHATVTPSNAASWALFRALAEHLGTDLVDRPWFTEAHFPDDGDHEAECLVVIGPLADGY